MIASERPRIGIVFNGDVTDPREWSGTPFGIYSGLRAAGVEPVGIDTRLPGALHKGTAALLGLPYLRRALGDSVRERARSAYSAAHFGPNVAALQSRVVAMRLRRVPKLHGLVQIGSGFFVPPVAPIATYEDMTIRQAVDYPYRYWSTLPTDHLERRIALQARCYAAARACCMTNSWAAASARDDYGVHEDKIHVVGVGTHDEPRVVARDWSPPRFLFVGVDWERKNGPCVLRAFRRLRESHPAARLDVVGGHPPLDEPGVIAHGRLRRDLPGDRERLHALFDAATCFVMPSLFEPSAVVYAEAAAAGLPTIGTRVGGSADLIGAGGLVVDPTSDEAVLDAMLQLAAPERAAQIAEHARRRAELFTWPAVAERLLRAIDERLLGRPLAEFL